MNVWARRAIVFVVVCLLAMAVAMAAAYRLLWSRYDNGLQQLEARSERLEGVVGVGSQISGSLEVVRQSTARWLHPGGESAQNDAQQRLRERIAVAGATLVSSQVALDAPDDRKLASVRLTATIDGEWPALVRFLEVLQSSEPPLWVRTVTFMREGQHTGVQGRKARVTLQLEAPLAATGVRP